MGRFNRGAFGRGEDAEEQVKHSTMQTDIIIAVMVAVILLLNINHHFKLKKIIMTNAEMLALLEEADTQTNEIAADIQSLIDSGGVSAEVAEKLNAHVEKLKGVAATHTP